MGLCDTCGAIWVFGSDCIIGAEDTPLQLCETGLVMLFGYTLTVAYIIHRFRLDAL